MFLLNKFLLMRGVSPWNLATFQFRFLETRELCVSLALPTRVSLLFVNRGKDSVRTNLIFVVKLIFPQNTYRIFTINSRLRPASLSCLKA